MTSQPKQPLACSKQEASSVEQDNIYSCVHFVPADSFTFSLKSEAHDASWWCSYLKAGGLIEVYREVRHLTGCFSPSKNFNLLHFQI